MDNGLNYGLPRYRRVIQTGLLAVGLALFIILGARGIQKIDDMNVAAGQRNKGPAAKGSSGYTFRLPFEGSLSAAAPLSFTHHDTSKQQNGKSQDNDKSNQIVERSQSDKNDTTQATERTGPARNDDKLN